MDKQCKQCGRVLAAQCFRPTRSRSKGIYRTTTGSSTICRECESLNTRAHTAMRRGDEETMNKLRQHYQTLVDAGHPPVTAAARRLMGLEPKDASGETNALLNQTELLTHIAKVRNRAYSSFDEADATHRRLVDRLKEAGLYGEANELLEEWYDET